MKAHIENFCVRRHETGADGLMRVQCVCNRLEEAAGNHADLFGVGLDCLATEGLTWVLTKMRTHLLRRPGPGEQAYLATWPVSLERVQFRRDFVLCDASDAVLATAVSRWIVMGTHSRKLERFPRYIVAIEPGNPPLAQECGDIRIRPLNGKGAKGPRFPVRLADIDQNRHANNVRYGARPCSATPEEYGYITKAQYMR